MKPGSARQGETCARWLGTLAKYRHDFAAPSRARHWAPALEICSRDELRAIQNDKLAALTPFLYENSGFYRRRFDRLGLLPSDIQTVDDLPRWPVVDKSEMMADAAAHPPYGTYTTMTDEVWADRGWMKTVAEQIAAELRTHCEVRAEVDVLRPDTRAKTEFKAKRVRDERKA